jgi:hypothetical protein
MTKTRPKKLYIIFGRAKGSYDNMLLSRSVYYTLEQAKERKRKAQSEGRQVEIWEARYVK